MLDILERFVQKEGYEYLRMDGGTAIGSRHVLVNKFNQVSPIPNHIYYMHSMLYILIKHGDR